MADLLHLAALAEAHTAGALFAGAVGCVLTGVGFFRIYLWRP